MIDSFYVNLLDGVRVQTTGGSCLYIDMEHKADDEYVRSCIRANGVEPTDVYVVKPLSGTDALDIVKAPLNKVDLIVIDSLTALVTCDAVLA